LIGNVSDHASCEADRHFASFFAAPHKFLGKGINLIVIAPGKRQQFRG